jgi:hypothetical protein
MQARRHGVQLRCVTTGTRACHSTTISNDQRHDARQCQCSGCQRPEQSLRRQPVGHKRGVSPGLHSSLAALKP